MILEKKEFWWMGEMWTPFLDVCKCAEKLCLAQEQQICFDDMPRDLV